MKARPIPIGFSKQIEAVDPTHLSDTGAEAVGTLQGKGFGVYLGITLKDVDALNAISNQKGVQEFCYKDCRTDEKGRFGNRECIERWLAKRRVALPLRRSGDLSLVGNGWTGLEAPPEDVPELAGCKTTFAIRLSEEVGGQGLAVPYTIAMTEVSASLYGLRGFWLETWGSNVGAWKSYEKAGWRQVAEYSGARQTADEFIFDDVRRFYILPDSSLGGKKS